MSKKAAKKGKKLNKKFISKKYLLAGIVGVFAVLGIWLFWGLPLPSKIGDQNEVSTKIYDRHSKLIYEIYSDKKRTPVKLDEIPEHVKDATIAIEDKDFYKHGGFSVTGIIRAFYSTIFQQKVQGGSTLTQQLV